MRIYLQDKTGVVIEPASLQEVGLPECKLLWVDLEKPSSEELALIGRFFDIHPVALEECQKEETLPKVQEFANHLFIIWDFLRDDPSTEKLETSSLCMFLGANYLVTIHKEPAPEFDRVLDNLEKEPSLYKEHPAPVLYSILDTAVDEYFPLVEDLTEKIDTYMESLLLDQGVGDLKTILTIKHRNMAARRMITAHRDVVMKLARRDIPFIPEGLSVYIMDVYDHLVRIGTEVENNSDLISSSLDIHLNAVSNRLNVTMKRLTTIALVFMPLTFLVGLYGMNFRHMPEIGWRYGYLLVWIMLLVIAIVMIIIARVKDWF
ncbi:MAG: magnesium/cobalt transporter CorA [Actinobacteria bacterium]|nr:magnesium/cobalt transporter CorA [Actinomycetota bacterium]